HPASSVGRRRAGPVWASMRRCHCDESIWNIRPPLWSTAFRGSALESPCRSPAARLGRTMKVCPRCGESNAERARFCQNCGYPFPERETIGEERKTVTVVFCDLVGFTARSDQADPEDVKATLR